MRSATTALMLLALAGCAHTTPKAETSAKHTVKLQGDCIELLDGPVLTPQKLRERLDQHLLNGRHIQARWLIERFPAEAQIALRDVSTMETFAGSVKFKIAAKFLSEVLGDYDQATQAVTNALTRSDAQRRAGNVKAAVEHWQSAVRAALHGSHPLRGPSLWERLCYLRPAVADWPVETVSSLGSWLVGQDMINGADVSRSAEACVWLAIGQWRLDRGEPKGALAALKRAESHDPKPAWQAWVQLHQARAFMQLEQSPSAVTLLTNLSEANDFACRHTARAMIGSCKLQDGHVQQALVFLKKAIEEGPTTFAGRADAEADLGLAYLSVGDETNGFKWLHSAQERVPQSSPRLLRMLENEMRYLQETKRATQEIETRVKSMQAQRS